MLNMVYYYFFNKGIKQLLQKRDWLLCAINIKYFNSAGAMLLKSWILKIGLCTGCSKFLE